jgi:hypothetical protein
MSGAWAWCLRIPCIAAIVMGILALWAERGR